MDQFKNCFVGDEATVADVIKVLDKNVAKICIVVDADDRLLGTVTDGDIRRAILNGRSFDEPVGTVMFKNPMTGTVGSAQKGLIRQARERKLEYIPILDHDSRVIDVLDVSHADVDLRRVPAEVILMAGGLGSRLWPLTESTPKPLLAIGEKPMIEIIIENFVSQGLTDITIAVNYKKEMMYATLGDGARFGANINYIEEDNALGTAGALGFFTPRGDRPVIVMNADVLTDIAFSNLLLYHLEQKSQATMCIRRYDFQIPYGVVQCENSEIIAIKEKPIQEYFVNAGIYVLNSDLFARVPENTPLYMTDFFNMLSHDGIRCLAFPIREYWLDIGQKEDFKEAQSYFTERSQ